MAAIHGLIKLNDYLFKTLVEKERYALKETIHFSYGDHVYQMNQNTPYFALKKLMRLIDLFRAELQGEGSTHREIFLMEETEVGPAIKINHEKDYYYFYRFFENARVPSRY